MASEHDNIIQPDQIVKQTIEKASKRIVEQRNTLTKELIALENKCEQLRRAIFELNGAQSNIEGIK